MESKALTFGSLFAGIGAMDLGLERAGLECKWQVEKDEWCRRVLAKHWPDIPRYADVRDVGAGSVAPVDLICGGFPCQDISHAGKRAGIDGERSGLWSEFSRLVGELRPRYVLVENVAALLGRGLDRVLGDLAEIGYDAEWDCIPAAAVGAPHLRDRIFILAYPGRLGDERWREPGDVAGTSGAREGEGSERERVRHSLGHSRSAMANTEEYAERSGLRPSQSDWLGRRRSGDGGGERGTVADSVGHRLEGIIEARPETRTALRSGSAWWTTEPPVGRVVNGTARRVDRLRGLGNAVVPQVAEFIGRQIMEHEA